MVGDVREALHEARARIFAPFVSNDKIVGVVLIHIFASPAEQIGQVHTLVLAGLDVLVDEKRRVIFLIVRVRIRAGVPPLHSPAEYANTLEHNAKLHFFFFFDGNVLSYPQPCSCNTGACYNPPLSRNDDRELSRKPTPE